MKVLDDFFLSLKGRFWAKAKNAELLNNKEVLQEIARHLWIESEKAGVDISFDKAAKDWLNRYSDSWLAYHKPATKVASKRAANKISKKQRR